jgi:hypothetical protein
MTSKYSQVQFGVLAIEKGIITAGQLGGLTKKKENREKYRHIVIDGILIVIPAYWT